MIKSLAFLSVVASAAVAQTSTSSGASSTPTANPYIPTSISQACGSFLTTLNNNASLVACVKPIADATAQFGPSGNQSTPSQSAVTAALGTLCVAPTAQSTGGCSDETLRTQLASFYTACTTELTSATPNADVLRLYDVIYALTPLRQAVCAKDDSGNYCVTQAQLPGTGGIADSNVRLAAPDQQPVPGMPNLWQEVGGQPLRRRQEVVTENHTAALVPNITTFRDSGLPFLFLTPSSDTARLCASCTRAIMMSYIAFEQTVPYAPGLAKSLILGGQTALYQAINSACGTDFLSGAVQAQGGLSGNNNPLFGAATAVSPADFATVGSLLAAVAVAFAAVL